MHQRTAIAKQWVEFLAWFVKLAVAAVVVWYIASAVSQARADFARQSFSFRQTSPGWLAAACGLYGMGMVPMWWFWHQILWALGQQPRATESMRAYFIGQLGKYVPGKAMVVVLRTGFVRGSEVNTTVAAVSVFVETLTMMAVGAFVAGAIMAVRFSDQTALQVLAWLLMLATAVPTLPPIFRRLVAWLRVSRLNPDVTAALHGLTIRLILRGWAACIMGWSLFGLSLWAVLRAIPSGHPVGPLWELAPRLTASVTLAVVAGFVSLLPGGVGVRESVLNALMVPEFGEGKALVSAVLLRLAWLVTELVVSGILYLGAKPRDQSGSP